MTEHSKTLRSGGPPHAYTYGLPTRLLDRSAGRHDRSAFTPESLLHAPDNTFPSLWIRRTHYTFLERSRIVLNQHATKTTTDFDRLVRTHAELLTVDRQLDEAERLLAETPLPVGDELPVYGPGEARMDPEAIRTRREREHSAALAARQHAIATLRTRRSNLERELRDTVDRLDQAFLTAVVEARRIRDYYERRISTYLRRAIHRAEISPSQQHVAAQILPEPDWIQAPNPWVPSAIRNRSTMNKENPNA